MKFRPCIDIHNGHVVQIVGSSLKDEGDSACENFVSEKDSAYYAKLYKEKGLDDYRIVIVGRIPRDDFELPDNMIYVAHTDSKVELNHIYNAADVLVSFSSEETFGMTVVEAMAAGTYPVVMKNTACEEIVDMTIGTAVDRDALEVFKCLEGIFSSEKNSLSREEIHNHAAKFSREEYMKKLFEIYKKQD